ncbi:MAG: hypothetical protein KVP17_000895 [Porospora cf. gigantea B]|uniref:uncharacterized protein n=1 Tax=Porospora cf. gigantea B TaxID=2853592 RepID=UPI0035718A9F|nr:MAG: hypothetical protein KVP17_000895 [Porospora cf. gigantea B]
MVFRSAYDEPLYFTGAVRSDVGPTLATAVVAPLSDTAARVVKFHVSPGCPVEDSDSSGVTLLTGSPGGWAGGYIEEDVLNTVLFARHEVSAAEINVATTTSLTKTILPLADLTGVSGDRELFSRPPVVFLQTQYRLDDFENGILREPLYDIQIFRVTSTEVEVGIFASHGAPQKSSIIVGLMAVPGGDFTWANGLQSTALKADPDGQTGIPFPKLPDMEKSGNCGFPLMLFNLVQRADTSTSSFRAYPVFTSGANVLAFQLAACVVDTQGSLFSASDSVDVEETSDHALLVAWLLGLLIPAAIIGAAIIYLWVYWKLHRKPPPAEPRSDIETLWSQDSLELVESRASLASWSQHSSDSLLKPGVTSQANPRPPMRGSQAQPRPPK